MKYLKLSVLTINFLSKFGFWYMLTLQSDDSWTKRIEEAEKNFKEFVFLNKTMLVDICL